MSHFRKYKSFRFLLLSKWPFISLFFFSSVGHSILSYSWLHCSLGILVPWPRTGPWATVVKVPSLNPWTPREFPFLFFENLWNSLFVLSVLSFQREVSLKKNPCCWLLSGFFPPGDALYFSSRISLSFYYSLFLRLLFRWWLSWLLLSEHPQGVSHFGFSRRKQNLPNQLELRQTKWVMNFQPAKVSVSFSFTSSDQLWVTWQRGTPERHLGTGLFNSDRASWKYSLLSNLWFK